MRVVGSGGPGFAEGKSHARTFKVFSSDSDSFSLLSAQHRILDKARLSCKNISDKPFISEPKSMVEQ